MCRAKTDGVFQQNRHLILLKNPPFREAAWPHDRGEARLVLFLENVRQLVSFMMPTLRPLIDPF
jgi:hypothetical protein